MKAISAITLEDDENCLSTDYDCTVTVRKKHSTYTRNSRILTTQKRLIVEVKSNLGGIKETLEISYLGIKAIRTTSEISSTGLTLALASGEVIHFEYFRNHLRGCLIYIFCISTAFMHANSQGNPYQYITNLMIDAVVPEDLFRSTINFPAELRHHLELECGISFKPGVKPKINTKILSAYCHTHCNAPKSIKDSAILDQGETSTRYSYLNETSKLGKPYRLLKIFKDHGGYVQRGQAILLIESDGEETMITTREDGYIFYTQTAFIGGTYFFGSPIFSISSSNKTKNISTSPQISTTTDNNDSTSSNINAFNIEKELEVLVGLITVKTEIRGLINFAKIQQERASKLDLKEINVNRHIVLTGQPGTGKTTVARIIGKAYKSIGLLTTGHFVETDRSGLVAGYLGQTSIKTRDVLEKARGGVLFIDEAYALAGNGKDDQYGKESIETILKYIEDYRNDIVLVVAGYSKPMKTFLDSNPGLKSRFNTFIDFKDYSESELFDIFIEMANNVQMAITPEGLLHVKNILSRVSELKNDDFGNARAMRNLLELGLRRQANRLATKKTRSREELVTLEKEDFNLEDALAITR